MRYLTLFFAITFTACSLFESDEKVIQTPISVPAGNEEEIKEILRLTRLITDVEVNISKIQREYGVVQTKTLTTNEMGQSNDQKLLSDIDAIFDRIKSDQKTIDNLKHQLKTYKSPNADVNRIKQQFEKILAEKDQQIDDLSSRLTTIQNTLQEKERQIQVQAETIVKQINHIENQRQEIDKLSQKHLILYARKETSQTIIEGNIVRIPQRLRRIEIVSFHDEESYILNEKNNEAIIQILNEEKFWDYNNYLIVRVKSRSL
jgi:predicted  nucleic acid-binding Zn-ribbon protein